MKKEIRRNMWRAAATVLVVAWMILIFSFSAQPDTKSSQISGRVSYRLVETANRLFHKGMTEKQMEAAALKIDYPVRKTAHMTEYGILAVLILHMLWAYGWRGKLFLSSLFMTGAYACTDEFHQLFIPGRAGRFTDVLIDSAGACIALAFAELIIHIYKKIKNRKR